MSDESAPDWNQLPHDPLAFFDLTVGFERKELKRSYGRLIRRYKPETHPEQFQRIRQAYEQLESQNRYGVQQSLTQARSDAWRQASQTSLSTANHGAVSSQSPRRNITQQAIDSPKQTYQRLRDAEKRTPQDFYVLAILADLIDRSDNSRFIKWILLGLQQYPADPGLQSVLAHYLRCDVNNDQAPGLLMTLAKVLPGESYFRLTEPVWDRLLDEWTFDRFAKLLDKCRQTIRRESVFHQAAFYVHLLKAAIWKADSQWVQDAFQMIEQIGAELGASLDSEMEFLDALRTYHSHTRKRIRNDVILQRIDEMIRDYCHHDWRRGAQTATQVLDEIGRNSFGMMQAFPIADEFAREHQNLVMLCMIIAGEVGETVGIEAPTLSKKRTTQQAHTAVRDLRETIEPLMKQISRVRWKNYLIYVVVPALLPAIVLWGRISTGANLLLMTATLLTMIAIKIYVLDPMFLQKRTDENIQRVLQKNYNSVWRPRLFRYIQSISASPQVASLALHEAGKETDDLQWLSAVMSFMHGDAGMAVFARSQLFVA